jgi:hypothetical protein
MKVEWKKCNDKTVKNYNCSAGGVKSCMEDTNILYTDKKDSSITVYAGMEDESSDFSLNYSDDEDSKHCMKGKLLLSKKFIDFWVSSGHHFV